MFYATTFQNLPTTTGFDFQFKCKHCNKECLTPTYKDLIRKLCQKCHNRSKLRKMIRERKEDLAYKIINARADHSIREYYKDQYRKMTLITRSHKMIINKQQELINEYENEVRELREDQRNVVRASRDALFEVEFLRRINRRFLGFSTRSRTITRCDRILTEVERRMDN